MSIPSLGISGIVIGILLLLGFVIPVNACFRHTRRSAFLISLYLLIYSEIILIAQIASVFHWLNLNAYVLGGVLLVIVAQLIWRKFGKPGIFGPFSKAGISLPAFRADPALWILGVTVLLAMLFNAFFNNPDPPQQLR